MNETGHDDNDNNVSVSQHTTQHNKEHQSERESDRQTDRQTGIQTDKLSISQSVAVSQFAERALSHQL